MNKRGKSKALIVVVLIIILLIWGYVGGQAAKKVGVTCDIGLGTTFCWKWHTSAVGQVIENINNAFGR